jgi:putative nucleotidyltransferase with HDIG domain
MTPLARFSLALAAVLGSTALSLGVGGAYLIGRYVEQDTATFTQDAVGSHFGTVFADDVFERTLKTEEFEELERQVIFHLAIYNVVAAKFFDPSGKIVFSYDESEVGRTIAPAGEAGLGSALAGTPFTARRDIVADASYGTPGRFEYGTETGHDSHAGAAGAPDVRTIPALELWVPVVEEGVVVGAAAVWRNLERIDAALRQIQLLTTTMVAWAALLLWLILRRIYIASSERIMAQARALEHALTERERTYDATLEALSKALDVRDTETDGHSHRVVAYMELIAKQLALSDEEVATLRRGALLHDIGKVGVPDQILRKPAALTEQEWLTMMKHPELGARIIGGISFLRSVSTIVRHHHERWDGTGYPDKLKGEQIPLGARIFAVADSFDAMTSDRPYRRAKSLDEARREIERCRGTQFDPQVVDGFMRVPLEELVAIQVEAPHSHRVEAAAS